MRRFPQYSIIARENRLIQLGICDERTRAADARLIRVFSAVNVLHGGLYLRKVGLNTERASVQAKQVLLSGIVLSCSHSI